MDEHAVNTVVQVLALLEPQDLADARIGFMEGQQERGIPEDDAAAKWEMLLRKIDEWRALEEAAGN